ncbi:MAG TPA: 2Fe-2S iron-sulfur cluster-binding protein, partial [Kiritimatiellia bacterium]|nr:2Fe-2S iron-sulfur cluster-binding protein [Kiritimatiellia bacterium]
MSIVKRTWKVNGRTVAVRAPAGRRLLDFLREDLGLIGSKESCGEGECGACTVIVDDEPVVSCILPVGQLPDGTEILTVEGVEKKRAGRLV